MVGTDIESELGGPFALLLSFDFQERIFDSLATTSPQAGEGGNGQILRFGLGLKLFTSPIDAVRLFAQPGVAINIQDYADVHEYDIFGLGIATKLASPSSAFTTPYLRAGIDVFVVGSFGISGSGVLIQGEHGGFFTQASAGLFFTW